MGSGFPWLEAQARVPAGPGRLDVLGFWEEEEPDLLASDLSLTEEGGLVWATAVRYATRWPEFLKALPPVPVKGLKSLDGLFMEPSQRQAWVNRVLSSAGRDRWRDSAALSLRLWGFFQKPFPGWRDGSENKSIRRGLISADLAGQDRFLSSHLPGVGSVFLFLATGCVHDCVFCKAKPEEAGQTLAEISAKLKAASRLSRKKIALAGNEPLLHHGSQDPAPVPQAWIHRSRGHDLRHPCDRHGDCLGIEEGRSHGPGPASLRC